jgi:hypothetical protein
MLHRWIDPFSDRGKCVPLSRWNCQGWNIEICVPFLKWSSRIHFDFVPRENNSTTDNPSLDRLFLPIRCAADELFQAVYATALYFGARITFFVLQTAMADGVASFYSDHTLCVGDFYGGKMGRVVSSMECRLSRMVGTCCLPTSW